VFGRFLLRATACPGNYDAKWARLMGESNWYTFKKTPICGSNCRINKLIFTCADLNHQLASAQ